MTAPLVHSNPARELTLSEADPAARSDDRGSLSTARAQSAYHITLDPLAGALVAEAIAAHLSPRAGTSLARWDDPDALDTRAAFITDALVHADRCPVCPVTLAVSRG